MALAESRVERLRVLPYQALLSDGLIGGDAVETPAQGTGAARLLSNGILVTWTVRSDRPVLSLSRTSLIVVTAEWSERGGHRRTIRLGIRRANPRFTGGIS